MKRIYFFSDLHLSDRFQQCTRNWDVCLAAVEEEQPDLVVLGGDLALDDPDDSEDRKYAHGQISRLTVPWRAVPGNHDVGDAPPKPFFGQYVSAGRLKCYRDLYGFDRWHNRLDSWHLIGLNSLLLGSDLPEEDEQYQWLSSSLRAADKDPIALFLHKPLCLSTFGEEGIPQTTVSPLGRRRLMGVLAGANLKFVCSGHLHRANSLALGGVQMIWAPSLCQVSMSGTVKRDAPALRLRPSVGWVSIALDGEAFSWQFRTEKLIPFDVTDIEKVHRSMRFAPTLGVQPASA